MSIFNGNKISVEIFGASHDAKIGVKAKGFPKFKLDLEQLREFLDRRKASNGVFSTTRKEADEPIFYGLENEELSSEWKAEIINSNIKSKDYDDLYGKPRPSHADYAWSIKDNTYDFSGGGRFSGRLTAPFCIAGGIAKQYLSSLGIEVCAYVSEIGKIKAKSYKTANVTVEDIKEQIKGEFPSLDKKSEIIEEITKAKSNLDSVGGKIECIVSNLKAGVGDNLFGGLEGKIAYLLYAIPAVKGVEFGLGFGLCSSVGSQVNDEYYYDKEQVKTKTNNSGGINGGISNGNDITLSVAIRPTPSIAKEQNTVDLINKKNVKIAIKGRHDSCIVPRAVPVVESAVALAILDEIL